MMIPAMKFRLSAFAAMLLLASSPCARGGFSEIKSDPVIVIYATQPDGLARDCTDSDCKNGPVAKALVEALKRPNPTVAEIFDSVNAGVAAATARPPLPTISAFEAVKLS